MPPLNAVIKCWGALLYNYYCGVHQTLNEPTLRTMPPALGGVEVSFLFQTI